MFTCSGTDFYDVYTGVGARRIRETFEKLRNYAPAILFIDEFDALGASRGAVTIARIFGRKLENVAAYIRFAHCASVFCYSAIQHLFLYSWLTSAAPAPPAPQAPPAAPPAAATSPPPSSTSCWCRWTASRTTGARVLGWGVAPRGLGRGG